MARHVDKPWGHETIWSETSRYTGKLIHIDAGKRLSLQYHESKQARIVVLQEGESADILAGEIHRFEASSEGDVEIVEVATPEIDDVVRLEDDYSREGTTAP